MLEQCEDLREVETFLQTRFVTKSAVALVFVVVVFVITFLCCLCDFPANDGASIALFIFIGPESDHWKCLSVTD